MYINTTSLPVLLIGEKVCMHQYSWYSMDRGRIIWLQQSTITWDSINYTWGSAVQVDGNLDTSSHKQVCWSRSREIWLQSTYYKRTCRVHTWFISVMENETAHEVHCNTHGKVQYTCPTQWRRQHATVPGKMKVRTNSEPPLQHTRLSAFWSRQHRSVPGKMELRTNSPWKRQHALE